MLNNIFLKTLRDQSRSLLMWGTYLVALAVLMALFFPTISHMTAFNQYLSQLPAGMKEMFGSGIVDYTSPTGYFSTELFSMMVPLLLLVSAPMPLPVMKKKARWDFYWPARCRAGASW